MGKCFYRSNGTKNHHQNYSFNKADVNRCQTFIKYQVCSWHRLLTLNDAHKSKIK